jgi:N-acetylmuramoyl-L-alanine amidase
MLFILLSLPASAENFKYDFPPSAAEVNVNLDGRSELEGEAAIIDSVTYVPLRSFSELCDADSIGWNGKTGTATVEKYNMRVSLSKESPYIEASGRYFMLNTPILNINDRLFVPVREMAKLFSLDVKWDDKMRTVVLKNTNKSFIGGDRYYSNDDLYWLSRIISAEARGEVLRGKIAVGNVVLNRVNDESSPNTVYDVIFDRRYGIQFTPAYTSNIYKAPLEISVIAARICLEGYTVSEDALFFYAPKYVYAAWIEENREYLFTIGGHKFFA